MTGYRSVLITGASSGIGRALALRCAAPGVTLHLSGRDALRLEAAAAAARARGAAVHPRLLDVRDRDGMADWIAGAGPLDLVVANAGITAGTGGGLEAAAQSRAVFATNLDGAINTVQPALAAMVAQPPGPDGCRGRIAVVASMAVFIATPGAPAYAASKTAIDVWTQATGVVARDRGVRMTSFCPGYVRSAITERNSFHMPGLMTAERAAELILRGLRSGKPRVAFPLWMAASARVLGLLPATLVSRLLRALPGQTAVAYMRGPDP
ncbi:SDR family NAD(P)-dependent oxidoreductase [Roseomonas sp. BN140053]|uniref:SDR family NAD(P)-dependent oxidoreductase n=1 Tax=Roseomonas sp. BN140053 TaxID=3391898 RepID=UPI0039EBB20A